MHEHSEIGFELKRNDMFHEPDFVEEGMKVIAPYIHEGNPTGLWCRVSCAAGYHARATRLGATRSGSTSQS